MNLANGLARHESLVAQWLEHPTIERFSFKCRKTKTKVITHNNHNSRKQLYVPIRARSKYMSPVASAGKRVRVNHDWFWFLLGRGSGARFLTNHKA